jgi:group I intron endonuclease
MKKYNYVYRITNKVEQKHYYGVRGCNVEPKLDLGIKYFSSSRDKEFKDDQKNHSENYKYKIVRICSTRKEADALEIKLQKKFNVGKSEAFYNKATRTSMGFDRTGTTQTPETRQKMSEAKTGENNPNFGKDFSPETKLKMSEAHKGENHYMFGKYHSEETKLKMSEAKQNMSDETKQKMSEAHKGENHYMFGKYHSEETKLKMSEAHTGVPKGPQEQVQCPHCGKIGGKSLMARWHFDNCKYKESEESEEV